MRGLLTQAKRVGVGGAAISQQQLQLQVVRDMQQLAEKHDATVRRCKELERRNADLERRQHVGADARSPPGCQPRHSAMTRRAQYLRRSIEQSAAVRASDLA